MKNIIKKSITTLSIVIMALTLAMPVTAQAATPRLNKTKITVNVKKSYQLKVTGTKKKAKWTTSNKKVATVSKNGKVTAKKKGSATITAKINKKTYKCKVTVTEPAPKLNKSKVTLTITNKKTNPAVQLKVANIYGKKVTWYTSNKKVATVSKSGKVVAKKKGTAVIRAKVGAKTLTCKVTVKDSRKPSKPSPAPKPVECQHYWVQKEKVVGYKIACNCGYVWDTNEEWCVHGLELIMQGKPSCGSTVAEVVETWLECKNCHATKDKKTVYK